MESSFLDNQYGMVNKEALDFIDELFRNNLSMYSCIFTFSEDAYFEKKYQHKNVTISIGSGRANIEFYLEIDNKFINLMQYDKNVKNVVVSSKKNILYIFQIIKRYLVEHNGAHHPTNTA